MIPDSRLHWRHGSRSNFHFATVKDHVPRGAYLDEDVRHFTSRLRVRALFASVHTKIDERNLRRVPVRSIDAARTQTCAISMLFRRSNRKIRDDIARPQAMLHQKRKLLDTSCYCNLRLISALITHCPIYSARAIFRSRNNAFSPLGRRTLEIRANDRASRHSTTEKKHTYTRIATRQKVDAAFHLISH